MGRGSHKCNIGDYLSVRDMLHQVAIAPSPAPQPPSLPPRQCQGLSGRVTNLRCEARVASDTRSCRTVTFRTVKWWMHVG